MALHKSFPDSPHTILDPDIRWFPADEAQREALETIIYLYDVVGVQDKHDMMRFDASVLYREACSTRHGGVL